MIETLHTYYWMYNLSKGKVKSHRHCKINFTQVLSTRHPCPSLPTQLISPRQTGHSSPESHRYSLMTELHWWPCRNWCRKSRGYTPCQGCCAVDSSDGECMLPNNAHGRFATSDGNTAQSTSTIEISPSGSVSSLTRNRGTPISSRRSA